MPTLLVCLDALALSDRQLDEIRADAPGYDVVRATGEAAVRLHLDAIEIALGRFPPALVAQAPRLRWIQSWSAGLNWLVDDEAFSAEAAHDITITSASGVHAVPIGEHVLALLLALARNLRTAIQAQDARVWASKDGPFVTSNETVFELAGKTLVLLGVGSIGTRVIRLATAFGMTVVAVRHSANKQTPGANRTVGTESLLDVLPEADAVVVTLPLTDETRALVGTEAFEAMKPSAVLVNVGRGEVVVEAALVAALREGRIAGAGLDVFEEEPLPPESPLWAMPNVIVTPHSAGDTPHYAERALGIFVDNLSRYRDGRDLVNVVDPARGY